MEINSKEDLYQEYRIKMFDIEERKEEYQRRKREFEQELEVSRECFREEHTVLEHLAEMWGECEDIGRLRCELGDFIDSEQKNLNQKEEELAGEYQDICRQERAYEAWYEEACRNLAEEDESWQG
ncbi:hypothetical protein [Clostridium porci]|uniref:Uncharacterized protein n=1 Tax=Clostridium porci TaxID=2605778 RepID=A0A7X2NPD2_9CLOT|nr:hypothetical protein [Clostridium porci]MSS38612.1 hypothetical protein [Clostridium porci]